MPGEPTIEEQTPVEGNHREICRFESPDDKTYTTFVRYVRDILTADAAVENKHYWVPHKPNRYFTGRSDIFKHLSNDLIRDRHFEQETQQIFVLYGLGGSGKTQISLKFAQDHRDE